MVGKTPKANLIGALLLVVGAMFGFFLWGIVSGVILGLSESFLPRGLLDNQLFLLLVSEIGAAGIGLLFLTVNGYWQKKPDFRLGFGRGSRLGLPVLIWAVLLAIIIVIGQVSEAGAELASVGEIICFLLYLLAVGVFEEFIFRGILLESFLDLFAKTRRGRMGAALFSSLIFGAYHMVNMLAGASFSASLTQSCYASITGLFLAALYIRTRNIWVCVFYHAFWDGCVAISLILGSTELVNENAVSWQEACFSLILVVPALVTALFLLLRPGASLPPQGEAPAETSEGDYLITWEEKSGDWQK